MIDWVNVIVTIVCTIITSIFGTFTVIYSNRCTKRELEEQRKEIKAKEKDEYKKSKRVFVRISQRFASFNQLCDQIIAKNDFNRKLLFSGNDGFDFFDNSFNDSNLWINRLYRILVIENLENNTIENITIVTKSVLKNLSNKQISYETSNNLKILRQNESIFIRISNEEQDKEILYMCSNNIFNSLEFECKVCYSTLADERIEYIYQIVINDGKQIIVQRDEVEKQYDLIDKIEIKHTIFRDLQDHIVVDRSGYMYKKMGQYQFDVFSNNMENKKISLEYQNNCDDKTTPIK